jgi:hypothetical protein
MSLMWRSGLVAVLFCLSFGTAIAELNPLDAMIIPGDLIKGHADIEPTCKKCHQKFKRAKQNDLCLDCHEHKAIAEDVQRKSGFHGRIQDKACSECHTDHKGRKANIVQLNSKTFNHKWTDFPLTGGHASSKVECKDCHRKGSKHRDAPQNCYSCHRKDDTHKGSLGKECESCHVADNWKKVRFDHSKTDFPLLGKHRDVKCASCHKSRDHKQTPKQCYSCHRKDDDRKGHKGKFGQKCETCHTAKSWTATIFNHTKETGFPLRGKHNRIKCASCHKGVLGKEQLGKTCYACHKGDDVHKGQEGRKCESCHNESNWTRTLFDHGLTAFPLLGKHVKVKCKNCHKDKTFKDAPIACIACHRRDDEHRGRLGEKCETCHGAKSWKAWTFDHNRQTSFALTGKHKPLKCTACHTQAMKKVSLAGTCSDCHGRDDVHDGSFGLHCERCHVDTSWGRIRNLPSMRH